MRLMYEDWRKRRWLNHDLDLIEAHQAARKGWGRVEDDGHPPALWIPAGDRVDERGKS